MHVKQIYLHLSYICRISNLDSGKVGCGLAAVKTSRNNLISAAEVEADLKPLLPSSGQRLLYRVIDFELADMLDDSGDAGGGVHDPSTFSRCVKMAGRQADPSDQDPQLAKYGGLCSFMHETEQTALGMQVPRLSSSIIGWLWFPLDSARRRGGTEVWPLKA